MSEIGSLIEKLNPQCKEVLEKAAQNCVRQTHFNVELEHFVLELLEAEDSDIIPIFRQFDLDHSDTVLAVRNVIEGFKRGNGRTPSLSPHLIQVLQNAYVTATLRLDENLISSGAILAAIIEEDTFRAMMVEASPEFSKINRDVLSENLHTLIAKGIEHEAEDDAKSQSVSRKKKVETNRRKGRGQTKTAGRPSALELYTNDLTAEARKGSIDPIIGRDAEIRQIIDILLRRRQNNPIITGEPGVGKTAVVEGLAQKVAMKEVPPSLQNISINVLDLGLLQAGAGVKGEFEERLKNIISEVTASPQPIILFIDEAHTLIGAGGAAGQGDAANLLKPALARGELRTIAATTWSEYKKYFEKDPALTRRFQVISVEEPNEETAVQMLRALVPKLEKHHEIRILDEALVNSVKLSNKYITSRQLPDKAISVLDTACARVAAAQSAIPQELQESIDRLRIISDEISILAREESSGIDHKQRFEELEDEKWQIEDKKNQIEARWKSEQELVLKIATLEKNDSKNKQNRDEIDGLKIALNDLQDENPMIPLNVDSAIIASVVSGWTGIPVGRIHADELDIVMNLRKHMERRIVGQSFALETIQQRIKIYRSNLGEPEKPTAVFLLVGPSGVGKTETAISLAELLYGGARNMVSINMSEYQEAHSVAGLKGAPPGYVGYGSGGVLTEAVRRNPYSIVLLDEVEKAHPDVLEIFYQVFDKGILEDSEGVSVNFKNTIILLTTNLASDKIMGADKSFSEEGIQKIINSIRPELSRYFKPALLGRMTIVPYLSLTDEQIKNIVKLKLKNLSNQFLQNHGAILTYEEKIEDVIAERCQEIDTGARNIDAIINQNLLPKLSEEILLLIASEKRFNSANVILDKNFAFKFEFSIEE